VNSTSDSSFLYIANITAKFIILNKTCFNGLAVPNNENSEAKTKIVIYLARE